MHAIELSGVTAGYDGAAAAIRDLSLNVKAGEVVALLGANGAGKTATVNTVCGIASVHRGSVKLLTNEVTNASPRARARLGLATVVADRGLFTQLTVAENLRVGNVRRQPPVPLDSWFPDLLPLLDRRAGLLSGGEQTMLALARAVVGRPRALVVDELTTGLAPGFADAAFSVLRRTAAEWGAGVLLAEQSAKVALGPADRAYVLRRGEVVLEGLPGDIASRPGVLESTYLGDMDSGTEPQ
jgi:branched-chain amino acid transport system ATP-binding protein